MSGFFGFVGPAGTAGEVRVDAVRRALGHRGRCEVTFATTRHAHSGDVCTFVECRVSREADEVTTSESPFVVGYDGPDRGRFDTALAGVRDLARHAIRGLGLSRLRGGFALAAWCPREGTLLLARDRAGLRPLFYAIAGESILFASEVRALLASGLLDRRISWRGLAGYLHFGALPDNLTLVESIRAVPPGHALLRLAGVGGLDSFAIGGEAEAPGGDAVREAIAASVRRGESVAMLDLECSGPCTELSGLLGEAGVATITNLSLGRHSEAPAVDGVESRTVTLSDDDAGEVMPGVLASFDQPCADGLASWLLVREAAAIGADLGISGIVPSSITAEPVKRPALAFHDYVRRLARMVGRSDADTRPVFNRYEIDLLIGPLLSEENAVASALIEESVVGPAPWFAALPQMAVAHGLGICAPRAGAGGRGGHRIVVDPIPPQIPLASWLGGPFANEARESILGLSREGILIGDAVRSIWRQFRGDPDPDPDLTRQIWALVVLGAWLARNDVGA